MHNVKLVQHLANMLSVGNTMHMGTLMQHAYVTSNIMIWLLQHTLHWEEVQFVPFEPAHLVTSRYYTTRSTHAGGCCHKLSSTW